MTVHRTRWRRAKGNRRGQLVKLNSEISEEIFERIADEAGARGVPMAMVVREIFADYYATRAAIAFANAGQ